MKISSLSMTDLPAIEGMQPAGWGPIIPVHRFYIDAPSCRSVKVFGDRRIYGIGTAIDLDGTGWLGHIIVYPEYRNRGIGSRIVEYLIERLAANRCRTVSLIATDLGVHLYRKFGFATTAHYCRFERDAALQDMPPVLEIPPANFTENDILKLDRTVTGECRTSVLKKHLGIARCVGRDNEITGFHLPTFDEGIIIAKDVDSGLSLLREKCSACNRVVVPSDNSPAVEFLRESGYAQTMTIARMTRGEPLNWIPDCVFSRAGGNLG